MLKISSQLISLNVVADLVATHSLALDFLLSQHKLHTYPLLTTIHHASVPTDYV